MEHIYQKKKKKNPTPIDFSKALEYMDTPVVSNIFEDGIKNLSNQGNPLKDLMLRELNNLSEIIVRHPDFKINQMNIKERKALKEFLNYFSECPICHQKNHMYSLKKVFIEEDKKIINTLSRLKELDGKVRSKFKFKLGIPCCNCYKRIFEDE